MNGEKRVIRQLLRERRRSLSLDDVRAATIAVRTRLLGFSAYQEATAIAAYWDDENEIATEGIIEEVICSGRALYLPQLRGGGALVRWRPGESLATSACGIPEPVDGEPLTCGAGVLVLVPLVGWDRTGGRLGRGGGFYDRILDRFPDLLRLGLSYDFQEVSAIPRDPWDVSLHYVITERRLVAGVRQGLDDEPLRKGGSQP